MREVEQLYLALFARAERLIYLENQYLTSTTLCSALCERLGETQGPEVVIVLPRETGAWLEQHTMDILRARQLERLREADRHARLRVYHPEVPDLESGCLMVHAKLAIVDDRWLRVGSANLSNRSMGLDTECDLCLEVTDEEGRARIAALRRELIGNLLGCEPQRLASAEREAGGLIGAIESIRADAPPGHNTLTPLEGAVDPEWERQLPDERLIDPKRPLNVLDVGDAVVGRRHLPHARRRLRFGIALVVLLAALAAYGLGAYLGRPAVDRLAGGRIHRLSERLARRGILTIIAVRIVPVAPFTLLNLLAGASHIRLRDYSIGTLIGMLPGVATMAVFAEGLMALLRRAGPEQFLLLTLALALIVGLTLLARRLLTVFVEQR
ncbi:VTT domain-containing protein [Marichromatium gracile]|uniref:PLD phosphodiesterase domain-containing protein n=1 Tax=Marichromatium gracile TaxID=1048 RepID=A0ABR5VGP7_MARGR|nr:VTT domain-containing protein [Marichromatium gracile]KXX64905.1 hypothetical protein AY586_02155 [Marichromatium gracile]